MSALDPKPFSLWKTAGKVYHEAIFQGQMTAAGSNVYRLTERMKKDTSYIAKQGRTVQIIGTIYLLFVAFISAAAFAELRGGMTHGWNAMVTTVALSVQMLIQSGYLLMLTILATAEILAPSLYAWIETLPISRPSVGSLRILALAREFMGPIIVILLTTPLVAGLAGRSIVGGVLGLYTSISHGAFTVGITVVASWKMRSVLRGGGGDDRKAKFTRVFTMLAYGLGTLLVVFVMQIASNVITRLFDSPVLAPGSVSTITAVLALLPLPTAPAALVTAAVGASSGIGIAAPIWMPIVGTLGFSALTLFLLTRVRTLLRSRPLDAVASSPRTSERGQTGAGAAGNEPIVVRRPRPAFRHQLAQAATRDTQVLISLLFPLILPLLTVVGPMLSGEAPPMIGRTLTVVMGAGTGGWLMVHGLTRLQFGSRALEATLPIRERDRVFPRLALSAVVPTIGGIIPSLIFMKLGSAEQISTMIATLSVAVLVPAAMLLKIVLFGRSRGGGDRYVLDEATPEARFFKWAAVVLLLFVGAAAALIAHSLLTSLTSPSTGNLLFVALTAAAGAGVVTIASRMFR